MWALQFALLALTTSVIAIPSSHSHESRKLVVPTVEVKNGTYVGIHSPGYKQDFFLGIPYAQPPVGNLRFRIPQSLNITWKGPRSVRNYSAACVPSGGDPYNYPVSEDCLYLNVVRPSGFEKQKLPVAVWIHGGGYYQGSGIQKQYNLSFIVQHSVNIGKPIIGVSINYRLSIWGFLMSREIVKSGNTNLGLRDQRLALHWVQENVEAFGGDPRKVTIWGESAGASSVGFHLVAYGGRDDKLFRGAIMESGSPVFYSDMNKTEAFQPFYDAAVQKVGCANAHETLQCLREVPFEELNAISNSSGIENVAGIVFHPQVDGDIIRPYPSEQLAQGKFVHVPIISGANSDEGTAFSPKFVNDTETFRGLLENYPFPALLPPLFAQKIMKLYPDIPSKGIPAPPTLPPEYRPPMPYGAQFRRSAAYWGDATQIALRRLTCRSWSRFGVRAYCYRFNVLTSGIPRVMGSSHYQEIGFVFLNLNGVGYTPFDVNPFANMPGSYADLARLMSGSWAAFVSDLDPNGWVGREKLGKQRGVPRWPVYGGRGGVGENIVWMGNVTSYVEMDSLREEGMALINAHNADIYHR